MARLIDEGTDHIDGYSRKETNEKKKDDKGQ